MYVTVSPDIEKHHHSFFRCRPVSVFSACGLGNLNSSFGNGLGGALDSCGGASTTNSSSSLEWLLGSSVREDRCRRFGSGGGGVFGTASSEADFFALGRSSPCSSFSPTSIGCSLTCGDAGDDGTTGLFALRGALRARFAKAEAVCALHVPLLSFAGCGSGVPGGGRGWPRPIGPIVCPFFEPLRACAAPVESLPSPPFGGEVPERSPELAAWREASHFLAAFVAVFKD